MSASPFAVRQIIANRASADVVLRRGAELEVCRQSAGARPPSSHRLIFKVSEMTVAVLLICIRQINYQLLFARTGRRNCTRARARAATGQESITNKCAQQFCHERLFDIASERARGGAN
jgi:hypothetical protein